MPDHETMRTESLNLAAALMAHGFPHVASECDGMSVIFVLEIPTASMNEAKQIVQMIRTQKSGVTVDVTSYEEHRNHLRDIVRTMNGGTGDGTRRRT